MGRSKVNWPRRLWFIFENLLAFAFVCFIVFQVASCVRRTAQRVEMRK